MAASGKEGRCTYSIRNRSATPIIRRRCSRPSSSATKRSISRMPGAGRGVHLGRFVRDPLGLRSLLGTGNWRFKFPIANTPVTKEGGVAAFKLEEKGGALQFAPAWVSRDMKRGEPVVVLNGMVFGYRSEQETKRPGPMSVSSSTRPFAPPRAGARQSMLSTRKRGRSSGRAATRCISGITSPVSRS